MLMRHMLQLLLALLHLSPKQQQQPASQPETAARVTVQVQPQAAATLVAAAAAAHLTQLPHILQAYLMLLRKLTCSQLSAWKMLTPQLSAA
jgi:hypothetical protein